MKELNKKIFQLLLGALIVFISSCNKDELSDYSLDDNYVQFLNSKGNYFVYEDEALTYSIEYQLIGKAAAEDIIMPIVSVDSALVDDNWVYSTINLGEKGISANSSITIKAGQYNGVLTVSGSYNLIEKDTVYTLILQMNRGNAQPDKYNNVFVLTVQKYFVYEFPGHYEGIYKGYHYSDWYAWGSTETNPGLDIELGNDGNTLVITNGFYQEQLDDWGEFWIDEPDSVTLSLSTTDNENYTVEIDGDISYWGTTNDSANGGPYEYWLGKHDTLGSFSMATRELVIKFHTYYEGPDVENDKGTYTLYLTDDQVEKLLRK